MNIEPHPNSYPTLEIHELWRCRACEEIYEVIGIEGEMVTVKLRGSDRIRELDYRIFITHHEKLTLDDVMIETGGIF